MKRTLILLTSTAIALVFGACNQHSWDEGTEAQPATKELFNHGHGHGHDDKDHGDKGHADESHEKVGEGEKEKKN